MRPGCQFSAQLGTSLLELTVVMALIAILAVAGSSFWDTGATEFSAASSTSG